MTPCAILSKSTGHNPPRQKWSYEDFVAKITALQARLDSMEIAIRDLELDCAQYRRALAGAQAELFKGLTENPFPFNQHLQKVWDDGQRVLREVGLKKLGRTALVVTPKGNEQ